MDVRVGVKHSPTVLEVDLGEGTENDTVQKEIDKVLSGGAPVLWLTDKSGRKVGVPVDNVASIEIGAAGGKRKMGFVGG